MRTTLQPLTTRHESYKGWTRETLLPHVATRTGKPLSTITRATEGISPKQIVEIMTSAAGDTELAMRKFETARHPDMTKVSVEGRSTYNPDDPFDLD